MLNNALACDQTDFIPHVSDAKKLRMLMLLLLFHCVLGTTSRKHASRPELMEELNRHRPMLAECLAALTACLPMAFLELELSALNPRPTAHSTEEADYTF
ncbi:unnamed protein product [Taenia asiatica]|uniref:NR LBD domain-containing protein n=1 Tax=Taenia asiatica TaxID=60517 RepID=A0A0R3WH62_TAEAS|nr:unnamed protein product [Taenia asiatica]